MGGKSLVVVLIIGIFIGFSIGYFYPQITSSLQTSVSNPYAGYTKVTIAYIGVTNQQFGEFVYFFTYVPNSSYMAGQPETGGYITVTRQNIVLGSQFGLTTNVSHNYSGITFAITEVHPDNCVIMAKLSA
jgi:hypothetical protein